jgi:hypothetical protein
MSGTSKPHGTNNSHSTESDIDETITVILVALAKGLGVLLWWSVLSWSVLSCMVAGCRPRTSGAP